MQEQTSNKFEKFYEKNYKILLVIPVLLIILSFAHTFYFHSQHNDFFLKDISLTGGTSVTLVGNVDSVKLVQDLSGKLEDISTREVYDLITQEKKAVIVETKADSDTAKEVLEEYLGYELISENSSFEFTGSTLSESFYKQLITAIWVAFVLMGLVVFLIFGKDNTLKASAAMLSLLITKISYAHISLVNMLTIFLIIILIPVTFYFAIKQKAKLHFLVALSAASVFLAFFPSLYSSYSIFIMVAVSILLAIIYFMNSIPSFAVIISAFADIFMTLVLVNILGIKMSSAGIVAFLMLIGYSVDTDILLTTRILKRSEGDVNSRLFSAFKTGITMTLTSLFAVGVALFIVRSFSAVLTQIFTILFIGLCFDIFNTWITNASIIKWYVEKK